MPTALGRDSYEAKGSMNPPRVTTGEDLGANRGTDSDLRKYAKMEEAFRPENG